MNNALANALGMQGGQAAPVPAPMNNMKNMMRQFQRFCQTFSGDPRQTVQQLMSRGEMSQAQFNQYSQMATQFANMFAKMMGR